MSLFFIYKKAQIALEFDFPSEVAVFNLHLLYMYAAQMYLMPKLSNEQKTTPVLMRDLLRTLLQYKQSML